MVCIFTNMSLTDVNLVKKKFFLVDAMALIYRAYFALQNSPRITSYGKNTNASFGFTNTLYDILKNQKPTHIAVAFDSVGATEREAHYSEYKANRQKAPEDLIDSIDDIKEIIKGFNIPIYEVDGYEADDIIGTIAHQIEHQKDIEIYMVTPDKDYGQLVRDHIFILKPPAFSKGFEKITQKEVCEKWGLHSVHQVVDMLALMGDASDNIPGIPGVGEKTATKLLQEYGTLENVLAHAHEVKGALGKKIEEGKEKALMSQLLARIITDVPIIWNIEECEIHAWDYGKLTNVFTRLEFKNIAARILPKPTNTSTNNEIVFTELNTSEPQHESIGQMRTIHTVPHTYEHITSQEQLIKFIPFIHKHEKICIDTETTGLDTLSDRIIGVSISYQAHEAFYIDLREESNKDEMFSLLRDAIHQKEKVWIGHNLKFDYMILAQHGIALKGKFFDTMIAKYVIADAGKKGMDDLSVQYLNYIPISFEELTKGQDQNHINLLSVDNILLANYAAEDADITFQLYEHLQPIIHAKEVTAIFDKVESPLIPVLASMETEGVKIDDTFLSVYATELQGDISTVEEKIYELSGERFNILSPKQLGEILFEKMKLGSGKEKTKTNQYATGEEVLIKLKNEHPIIELILDYRELNKLKSTYVDALPKLIHPKTQRIHTSYNQTIAITGRLSSQNPNLQNIPIRTAKGKRMREAFIPRNPDYVLVSADYSQIELRVIAAISKDENMRNAFLQNTDIHTATAAAVFGVPIADVNAAMRYKAKSVNFGIIYGQGAWGLAQSLSITIPEAKELIENYFTQYPGIKQYMKDTIAFAHKNGFVRTLMGRIRYLENIQSANHTIRSFAERNAINSPIQGTAADMIKLAMIEIHEAFLQRKMQSKLIMQVHDELVVDTHRSEVAEVKEIVTEHMINAHPLPNGMPIVVSVGVGDTWLESH